MKTRINKEERETSISELWWYVISKWKLIIVGIFIGALILGVYGGYSSYKANEIAKKNVDVLREYTMEDLTQGEQEEVKALIEKNELYLKEAERLEKDYLMSIDYNNAVYVMMTYYLNTDYSYNYLEVKEDYTNTLMSMYKTHIHSEKVHSELLNLGIEGIEEVDLTYICHVTSEGNVLKVSVDAESEWSKEIAEVLSNAIEEYYSIATELVGEHSLTKISEDSIVIYSEAIRNGQSIKCSIVDALCEDVKETEEKLNEKQLEVYKIEIGEVEQDEENNTGAASYKPESLINKKYIVVGAVLGVVIVAILAIWRYITSKKLRSIIEVNQVYNIEKIGIILRDDTKQRKIKKKVNKIKTCTNETEQKAYIADTIINKCKSEGIKEVTICSSITETSKIVEDMIKTVGDEGIVCEFINDINYNRISLAKAINSKNVIIAEILNVTTKDDIEAEIDICDRMSINVFGMIVII